MSGEPMSMIAPQAGIDVPPLARALERFRVLCEFSPDAVVIVDAAGIIRLANPHAEAMFGYAAGELAGQPVETLLPDDMRSAHRRYRGEYIAAPRVRAMGASRRLHGRRRDGTRFPVEISLSPLSGEGMTLVCSAIRDVSDRRVIEEQLRAAELRYRTLVEQATDGIFISDAAGRYLDVNPSGCAMLGYSLDEMLGLSIHDILASDEIPRLGAEIARLLDGSVVPSEWRFRRKDGTFFDGEVRARRLPDERMLAVLRDISERKRVEEQLRKSEARYRLLVENQTEFIVKWLPDGTRTFVNPSYCRLFGLSEEQCLGTSFFPLVAQDYREEILARIAALTPERPEFTEEHLSLVPGGQRWQQWTSRGIFDDEGHLVEMLSTGRDITERKQAEDQLRQSQKMQAIGQLAGGVAHDFNNLLTVINGYAEMLLAEPAQSHYALQELTAIREAGERAAQLTRQLLLFSRRAVLAPRVLQLNDLVEQVVVMLRRLIGEDIELRKALTPALPPIKADANQLEQLLLNLAINARDAMPNGGELTIETRAATFDAAFCRAHPGHREGTFVQLVVADDGVGMTDEVKAHLFEPFFTTKGAGRGLGLATAYGIVQESRGFITVASELGVGTTVVVSLPAQDPAALRRDSRSAVEDRTGETILLVEDEEAVRRVIALALTMQGYRVITADSGSEALRLFESATESVDLLVTDVVMPEMSGVQLAQALRERCPTCRVLFVSGYNEDIALRHLGSHDAFLQKPFTPRVLAQKVREILDRSR